MKILLLLLILVPDADAFYLQNPVAHLKLQLDSHEPIEYKEEHHTIFTCHKSADLEKLLKTGESKHCCLCGELTNSFAELSKKKKKINIEDGKLDRSTIVGVKIKNANMKKVAAQQTNMQACSFQNVDLSDANLSASNLSKAKFIRVNFTTANLSFANLAETKIIESNLTGTKLYGANLHGSYIKKCTMRETEMQYIDLSNSRMEKVTIIASLMQHIRSTENAEWKELHVQESKLCYINLQCKLKKVIITKCCFCNGSRKGMECCKSMIDQASKESFRLKTKIIKKETIQPKLENNEKKERKLTRQPHFRELK